MWCVLDINQKVLKKFDSKTDAEEWVCYCAEEECMIIFIEED